MSANFLWKPHSRRSEELKHVALSDKFRDSMERAGMAIPATLTEKHVVRLQAMAATCDTEENPYTELLGLIEKFGSIELWMEY